MSKLKIYYLFGVWSHNNLMCMFNLQPAKEIFGDDVPWWIKNKAPLQISPSTKSINLMKEKFGEDFMTVGGGTEDAQEATEEADETIADEYEEEEEENGEEDGEASDVDVMYSIFKGASPGK